MDSNITIKSGIEKMDFQKVTEMLAQTYWCPGIQQPEVIKGAEGSALVVGAFASNNEQIGFARVISDKTRFAYLLDVVVDENYRKQGIGQAMVDFILKAPELKSVYQWLLITKDAHGVYSKLGFKTIATPQAWMEIRNPRPE